MAHITPAAAADVGRPRLRMGRPRDGAVDAAERIVSAGGCPATIGVVLGTGLGGLADRLTGRWAMPSTETGWLTKSMATGHAGRIVCGSLRGVPVAMLQGRVHGYEGFPPETLTRGVELLAALGVGQVLLTNASGGLEPDMVSGELVIVTDHIDLVRWPWGESLEPDDASEPERTTYYDPELVDLALRATRRVDATARKGVYAFLSGPSYETRAEYRMLRRLGADVVGMSTVPEAIVAMLAWALLIARGPSGSRHSISDTLTEVNRHDLFNCALVPSRNRKLRLTAVSHRAVMYLCCAVHVGCCSNREKLFVK